METAHDLEVCLWGISKAERCSLLLPPARNLQKLATTMGKAQNVNATVTVMPGRQALLVQNQGSWSPSAISLAWSHVRITQLP